MLSTKAALLSVIIPVYNVEPYLEQCLDSVVNQTYKNIEIICINDGSTDNSLKILEKYQKKGGVHFANARSSSIVPLIRNLANRFM